MATSGDFSLWSDLFPNDLIPDILDWIADAWAATNHPRTNEIENEDRITRRLCVQLVKLKRERKHLLPFGLTSQCELLDDDGGIIGRIDITLHHGWSESVYFALECKRLCVSFPSGWASCASDYVLNGMMRFVSGQYSIGLRCGAMLGYVMDGDTNRAVMCVGVAVNERHSMLSLDATDGLKSSSLRPASPNIRETVHRLSDRTLVLHHMFLAVDASSVNLG